MYACADLIGRPYRLGADGTGADRAVDCIHMVYIALRAMAIPTPAFNERWYEASKFRIARDLLAWGCRISNAGYDGDVLLLQQERPVFAVVWSQGALCINPTTEQVAWCRIEALPTYHAFRCCHLSAN